MGLRVWGLGFGVCDLGFGDWGLEIGVWGWGFGLGWLGWWSLGLGFQRGGGHRAGEAFITTNTAFHHIVCTPTEAVFEQGGRQRACALGAGVPRT